MSGPVWKAWRPLALYVLVTTVINFAFTSSLVDRWDVPVLLAALFGPLLGIAFGLAVPAWANPWKHSDKHNRNE